MKLKYHVKNRFTYFHIGLLISRKTRFPRLWKSRLWKQSCDTVQQTWDKAGWTPKLTINTSYLQFLRLSFSISIYT